MAFTFEQLFKRKLESDIDTATSNAFNTVFSNDLSVYLTGRVIPQQNELLAILDSGKGVRMSIEGQHMISQPLMITFYVQQNYTQSFLAQLTSYANTASSTKTAVNIYLDSSNNIYYTSGAGRTLNYSYTVIYNTPFVSPNIVDLGLVSNYQEIVLQGNVTYSNNLMGLPPQFYFQPVGSSEYSEIKSIIEWSATSQALGEKGIYGTNTTAQFRYTGDEQGITLRCVYDATNATHILLRRYAYMPPIKRGIRIVDNVIQYKYEFSGYLRVNINGLGDSSSQPTLTIAITPDGKMTETYVGGGV